MTFRNRVAPTGELVADPARGTLTGNRGVLHDANGTIVRNAQVRRWITCSLEFRGWRREVMTPRRWTHVFFLDEATALAAGHRPCAMCRHEDYQRFRRAFPNGATTAQAMDDVLHGERGLVDGRRRTHLVEAAGLPDGAMVQRNDGVWLVAGGTLARWTFRGYTDREPLPRGRLPVLTPPSTLAVLTAGYRPALHPSADLRAD